MSTDPLAAPAVAHRPLVVRSQAGPSFGWRYTCTCGARSVLLKTRRDADAAGDVHKQEAEHVAEHGVDDN